MGEILFGRSGPVVTVTLSHPERRNALSVAMWHSLREKIETIALDRTVRCVILRGAQGHFAAGADISEFPTVRAERSSLVNYHENVIAPALAALSACPQPLLAAIEGVCAGGGLEVAARCDLRICADNAQLGAPIARLGFPMAPDELSGLLALLGPAVVLELLLEGRMLDAAEALAKGLVTRVVPLAHFASEVALAAGRLSEGAPIAARMNKALVRRLCTSAAPLSDAERAAQYAYAESRDHAEGVRAFLERRLPQFDGT